MSRSRARTDRDDAGAAAVEFALVIIPLFLIIGGIINFGVAFANQLALDNAVRQAARSGVVAIDPAPDLAGIVQDEYDASALRPDGVPVVTYPGLATCEGSTFGQSLRVRAEVTTEYLFPWPVPDAVLSDEILLDSEAEFQCEYS